jgi:hypothetical protein
MATKPRPGSYLARMLKGQEVNTEHLTPEERKAISALRALAKRWPASLTLFSNSGSLEVHRTKEFLQDPIASSPIAGIDGIRNDGGDRT